MATSAMSPRAATAFHINFACHSFEVIRIYARAVSTQMIKLQPFRYDSYVNFVRESVSSKLIFTVPKFSISA